jgi:hypothetical protein
MDQQTLKSVFSSALAEVRERGSVSAAARREALAIDFNICARLLSWARSSEPDLRHEVFAHGREQVRARETSCSCLPGFCPAVSPVYVGMCLSTGLHLSVLRRLATGSLGALHIMTKARGMPERRRWKIRTLFQ